MSNWGQRSRISKICLQFSTARRKFSCSPGDQWLGDPESIHVLHRICRQMSKFSITDLSLEPQITRKVGCVGARRGVQ